MKDPKKVVLKAIGKRGVFEQLEADRIVIALAEAGLFTDEVMKRYFQIQEGK